MLINSAAYVFVSVCCARYHCVIAYVGQSTPPKQVTLFKKNYDHVISDMYFKFYHTVAHNNPNYFITYGNGKSAARVSPGLRSNGAHRFHNYFSHPKCVVVQ